MGGQSVRQSRELHGKRIAVSFSGEWQAHEDNRTVSLVSYPVVVHVLPHTGSAACFHVLRFTVLSPHPLQLARHGRGLRRR